MYEPRMMKAGCAMLTISSGGMRDVDDIEHAEGDGDADRDGGVEAAEQDAGHDGVDQQAEIHVHARSPRSRCQTTRVRLTLRDAAEDSRSSG
jgi:hypothetical protein